jgi:hypothetical protein
VTINKIKKKNNNRKIVQFRIKIKVKIVKNLSKINKNNKKIWKIQRNNIKIVKKVKIMKNLKN